MDPHELMEQLKDPAEDFKGALIHSRLDLLRQRVQSGPDPVTEAGLRQGMKELFELYPRPVWTRRRLLILHPLLETTGLIHEVLHLMAFPARQSRYNNYQYMAKRKVRPHHGGISTPLYLIGKG